MAFINYLIHLGILICIYSILAVSLNLAIGFTGLLNLGHVGFFGIGAYTSALLSINGVPMWASTIAGGLLAMLFGMLLALADDTAERGTTWRLRLSDSHS